MKSITPSFLTFLLTALLTSCGFWRKDNPEVTESVPITKPIAKKHEKSELLPTPIVKTLKLTVDSQQSTGTISLALDPKGAVLGVRKANDTRPLEGTVTIKIVEEPSSGKKQISIGDIQLKNTEPYDMNFS